MSAAKSCFHDISSEKVSKLENEGERTLSLIVLLQKN